MSNCFYDVLGTVIPRTSFGRKVTESEGERGVVSHPGVPKSTAVGGLRGSVRACPEGTGSRVQCIDGEKFATAASKSANRRGNSCMHSSACAREQERAGRRAGFSLTSSSHGGVCFRISSCLWLWGLLLSACLCEDIRLSRASHARSRLLPLGWSPRGAIFR